MDSLTTMKHQSNEALLNRSSKAEQNNISLVEKDAFIRTVRGKQQLFPFFNLSPTICGLILVLYSPIPFCIKMFLGISPLKKVT